MTRLPHLRMIIDPQPNTGSWNMAVDEALLESSMESGSATLRWYRWREPTVSLGYFQMENELANAGRLNELPRVRRLSGGGALVHDRELTYSLTLPATQQVLERPIELYDIVHRAFIKVLNSRGAPVQLRGLTIKQKNEPLLCFTREDEHDLILFGHKILGSAQRRRRGAVLQHGGLLLGASSLTPELLGISDLAGNVDLQGMELAIGSTLAEEIADVLEIATLTSVEYSTVSRRAEC